MPKDRLAVPALTHLHGANYGANSYSPVLMRRTVRNLVRYMERIQPVLHFNGLAAQGQSGLLLLGALQLRTGLPVLAVRKPGEDCHSSSKMNGSVPSGEPLRYLFVDDFIATGATFERVTSTIDKAVFDAKCVGGLAYEADDARWQSYRCREGALDSVPIFPCSGQQEAGRDFEYMLGHVRKQVLTEAATSGK